MTTEPRRRFTLRQRLVIWAASWFGWALIWLLNSTVRFRVEGEETRIALRQGGKPVIYGFWHHQIFSAAYLFRFQDIAVVTSQHFDGEYIGRIIRRLGFRPVRGSSTRGGAKALLALRRQLTEGGEVAFTVDGPRGPACQVKPGPVFLSQISGAPLLAFHLELEQFWSLQSWDRFRIPRPFTRALVKFGKPLRFGHGRAETESLQIFQSEMDQLKSYCERYFGKSAECQAAPGAERG